jgi:hypothetical protein
MITSGARCAAEFRPGLPPLRVINSDPTGSKPRAYVGTTPESYYKFGLFRQSRRTMVRRTTVLLHNPRRMTMQDDNSIFFPLKRTPWNKGKLIGAKPSLMDLVLNAGRFLAVEAGATQA